MKPQLIKDCDFIALNFGTIRHKNVINLDIKDYYKKFFTSKKNQYLKTLKRYLTKKKLHSIHPVELEISNCRNEKYDYIHKIINIIILKEIIKTETDYVNSLRNIIKVKFFLSLTLYTKNSFIKNQ